MDILYNKSLKLGADDFGISNRKNKRFYVLYNDNIIHFGLKNGSTYIDHKDKIKRANWYARHSKIYDKSGRKVIDNPYSPSYWSANLLW